MIDIFREESEVKDEERKMVDGRNDVEVRFENSPHSDLVGPTRKMMLFGSQ